MKLPDHSDSAVYSQFLAMGVYPPKPAYYALFSLLGDQSVEAGLSATREESGASFWQVFALTKSALVVVRAEAGFRGWDYETPTIDDEEYELTAVALSLSSLTAVEATAIQERSGGRESQWSTDYVAVFSERRVPLPVATASKFSDEREAIESFALALLAKLR